LFLCGSEHYFHLADGDAFLGAWFPTAMCDLHHRRAGYMTLEAGYMTQKYGGWDGGGWMGRLCQRGVDGAEQSRAGKGLFEQSDVALQDFAFGHQFAGVAGHVYNLQIGMGGVQALD
jgi:hypothetical protein